MKESPFSLVRHELVVRRLSVKRIFSITPKMRRITLGGNELKHFKSISPEDHIKVFFPHPDEVEPTAPQIGLKGLIFPEFGRKAHSRDYTPLRFDSGALELDLEFYLHGHGLASNWASQAQPGDVLFIAGPRGSRVYEGNHGSHVFLGDATAIPEMQARIQSLPRNISKTAVFFVDAEQEFQTPIANETCHWLVRGSEKWPTTDDYGLEYAKSLLRELANPTDRFYWIAGEANQARDLGRYLHLALKVPQNNIHLSGHWKSGTQGHDHHESLDISK